MSEHDEQCAVVSWFKMQYRKYENCIIAIPNGSHLAGDLKQRSKQMNRLKKEGFKPGTSDIFVAIPRGRYCGLWLEMKDVNKTVSSVSQDQRDHLELMEEQGYRATWCAGSDQAMTVIKNYMGLK